ncbi:uncharacterized protein F5147DRAFT_653066 [Suillus discolor]|uniref:Uncharacterized protein n=1 Tax=Suillus discolor TaxID=1912936 RepID=A0A9P7F7F7_9AGAM|nr:uncharacterized protein F5147DRAFT_653066 [Suillus discolor]KAG2107969.1 hypothetical protein F5147DRAFT_653066 [Suillus discolor]
MRELIVNYSSAPNSLDLQVKTTTPTNTATRLTEGMAPHKRLHSIWISNLESKRARVQVEQSLEKEHAQVAHGPVAFEDVERGVSVWGAQRVQCEEVEEEDDLIAIRGVRWRERDQPAGTFLLEEIGDAPGVMSNNAICTVDEEDLPRFDGNDMDARSESDDESEVGADDGINQNEADTDDGINQNEAGADDGNHQNAPCNRPLSQKLALRSRTYGPS